MAHEIRWCLDGGGSRWRTRAAGGDRPWFVRSAAETAHAVGVDPATGLSTVEASDRQREYGPNLLAEAAKDPAWKKIVHLLADRMTIVLIIAAAVSALVSHERETPLVILAVIILNTVLNYVQGAHAESSLQALRDMSVARSRVRRDGREHQLARADLVPGDVVLLEAGDSVPADGRVVEGRGAGREQCRTSEAGARTTCRRHVPRLIRSRD